MKTLVVSSKQLKPVSQKLIKPRIFSKSQIQGWFKEDRLSSGRLRRIDKIVERFS